MANSAADDDCNVLLVNLQAEHLSDIREHTFSNKPINHQPTNQPINHQPTTQPSTNQLANSAIRQVGSAPAGGRVRCQACQRR